jgi:RNA polymerase sigma-70 factor, ECF subfamily
VHASIGIRPAVQYRFAKEACILDSLNQLMEAVHRGDQVALRELMNGHRRRLEALARRILGDQPTVIEDIVQEAFVAIWHSRGQYAPGKAAWPWIARIVRNGCHQYWRRKGGRRKRGRVPDISIELAEYVPAAQISPAAHAQQSELICLARQSVESLPPTYREVVQLSVLAGMPDEAVADWLGIPLGTVKSRKHRALVALREKLAAYDEDHKPDEQETRP